MILLYHKVHPEPLTPWWVSPDSFWEQMEQLQRFEVVSLDRYDPANPRQAVITFDGVYENVLTYAAPILKSFQYPFELFIVGEVMGQMNEFDQPAEPPARFADLDQLQAMIQDGARLQWHGLSHRDLSQLEDPEQLDRELEPRSELRKLDPSGLKWLAYPHGRHTPELIERVKKSFQGALSCVAGNDRDCYRLNRVTVTDATRFPRSTVSLIIANYNYGRFAAEAIESALRQTVPPDEILFIDDGSTDNSLEVANRYRDRIRIVANEKNLGIIDNFSKAVFLTRGDYVCFLGADNRFRSDYVQKCKLALDLHPDAAIAYTNCFVFGPRAEVFYEKMKGNETVRPLPHVRDAFLLEFPEFNEAARARLEKANFIHGSSMYRRRVYEEVGGYQQSKRPEDHDLFARMIARGYPAVLCPDYLLEYRQHSSEQANIQSNYGRELAHARRKIKEKEARIRELEDELTKKKSELESLYLVRGGVSSALWHWLKHSFFSRLKNLIQVAVTAAATFYRLLGWMREGDLQKKRDQLRWWRKNRGILAGFKHATKKLSAKDDEE